jgi:tRNA (adenine57-N1/adenine58-N1)-methyltransferase
MFDTRLYRKFKRGPQVIMLKDAAFISAFTGLAPGDKVLDCGGGSGFLTVYLASLVGKEGKVITYEKRDDFAEIVRKNVEKAGFQDRVELKVHDIFQGIEDKEFDLITLDFAESEKALVFAKDALKETGFVVGYLPNVEQAKAFVLEGEKLGLKHIMTSETIMREMLIREKGCRPETKGLFHTGYLTFLKK